jgi:hypothetical protein
MRDRGAPMMFRRMCGAGELLHVNVLHHTRACCALEQLQAA